MKKTVIFLVAMILSGGASAQLWYVLDGSLVPVSASLPDHLLSTVMGSLVDAPDTESDLVARAAAFFSRFVGNAKLVLTRGTEAMFRLVDRESKR